jgi:hypothetical protein
MSLRTEHLNLRQINLREKTKLYSVAVVRKRTIPTE